MSTGARASTDWAPLRRFGSPRNCGLRRSPMFRPGPMRRSGATTSTLTFGSRHSCAVPVQPAALEVLSTLAPVLARWGRWYLFGAQAVILYGVPRLSADVDVTL